MQPILWRVHNFFWNLDKTVKAIYFSDLKSSTLLEKKPKKKKKLTQNSFTIFFKTFGPFCYMRLQQQFYRFDEVYSTPPASCEINSKASVPRFLESCCQQ